MPSAILKQVVHDKHAYTSEMAMRQVAFHILRNPNVFYPYIEQELLETGESFESYCYNIFQGEVWGDDLIAAAFGHMWNISISIVCPIFNKPLHLFHTQEEPDVVLVVNGGCYTSREKASTHFSATRSKDNNWKMPGHLLYSNPSVPPNLEPIVMREKGKAKQIALREYKEDETEKGLELLRGVSTQ